MADKVRTASSSALAFIIGAGAGVALGMLFAPRRGSETREQLRQKAQITRNKLADGIQAEKDMVSDTVDATKQAVREGKEAISKAAEGHKSRAAEV